MKRLHIDYEVNYLEPDGIHWDESLGCYYFLGNPMLAKADEEMIVMGGIAVTEHELIGRMIHDLGMHVMRKPRESVKRLYQAYADACQGEMETIRDKAKTKT